MWLSHPSFKDVVTSVWSRPYFGSPISVLVKKLKDLKCELKVWNWTVFGDLKLNISKASEKVLSVQQQLATEGPSDSLLFQEIDALSTLDTFLSQEETYLREQSRIKWLKEGDRNSSFFHNVVKRRRTSKVLSHMQIGDDVVNDMNLISSHIQQFYKDLFTEPGNRVVDYSIVQDFIPSMVTPFDNAELCRIPTAEEIRLTVFDMDASSAPGPDGYSGKFFRHCWDIVHSDVVHAVQHFFIHGNLSPGLNSNFLVLIPKVDNAITIDQYRPIVLGNFIYKLITKIIADRLGRVCSRIISPHQFGFVPDRNIRDCIVGASECYNCLHKGSFGGNLAMKLDIRKAFDTMRWDFIKAVLSCFGFGDIFVTWIETIFLSARISILINGSPHGYFSCSRGVR